MSWPIYPQRLHAIVAVNRQPRCSPDSPPELLREIIAHNPRKRRGWVALNARRLRDFNTLRSLRGGFSEGCRNNAAKIYSWLLRCNATGSADIHGLVSAMASQCHPRLPVSSVKDAVRYSRTIRRMREQTIADWLDITRSEAEMFEGFP